MYDSFPAASMPTSASPSSPHEGKNTVAGWNIIHNVGCLVLYQASMTGTVTLGYPILLALLSGSSFLHAMLPLRDFTASRVP